MWRKIKSLYILKMLFDYVGPKRKLDIIIYNQKIKTKCGLNINDYKRCSGKYRKDDNGIIKEYNSYDNTLLFEGQFSNRKRNGKGRNIMKKVKYYLKVNIQMVKDGKDVQKNMMKILEN